MIYVVSYLIDPKRDITELLTEMKQPPAGWCHYLDDTWLLATKESATEIYNRLAKHLVKTDWILIIEMKPNASYFGFLPKDAWEWIDKYKNY
jgi:hypothetical protein